MDAEEVTAQKELERSVSQANAPCQGTRHFCCVWESAGVHVE